MREVRWGFGGTPLFEDITFNIEKGQRVCLVGRNGVGKSSLMKIVAGILEPDSGRIARRPGLRVGLLSQESPRGVKGSVFEVVSAGLPRNRGERDEEWRRSLDVDTVLSRLKLDPETKYATLSGGLKRRTLLARALVDEPDILLLDEPTNQLDIESITWLEEFLLRHVPTLFFVSHDRMFLRRLADRIVELDRGKLTD